MKTKLHLFLIISNILLSCNSVKQTERALNTGNYDEAINIALNKLKTNKDKKGKQPYIKMLEDAYAKVVERDINAIEYLKKDANPANLERIYNNYLLLKDRQESIKPLLPLYLTNKGRNAKFPMNNYDSKILETKEKLSEYLLNNAKKQIANANSKGDYRKVFEDLKYLDKINPDYKNSQQLIGEAHHKGTDFIIVKMKNNTNVVIPKRLETDMLNFSTYGLDNFWTVYHNNPQASIEYDYAMEIGLRQINISPEQIKERQLQKEKLVKDGWEYLLDDKGETVLDDKGEKIKVDKMAKVKCEYYEYKQFKAVNVIGNVQYKDLKSKQLLDAFPLSSEHVFEHVYANYNGDKRALGDDLIHFLGIKSVPFPTNEQMIYDSGEDLKNQLKNIITRYQSKQLN